MQKNFIDITDKRYGRLVAKKTVGKNKSGAVVWECKCDCGKVIPVVGTSLRNKHTKSCGCLRDDIPFTQIRAKLPKTKHKKSSIYKGVHWCNSSQKWIARVSKDNKRHFLGHFDNETDAAKEYNIKAKELYKYEVFLNKIKENKK